jgi:uridine phosphorylase
MDAIVTAVSVTDVVTGIGGIAAVIALALVARMGARKLLGMIK